MSDFSYFMSSIVRDGKEKSEEFTEVILRLFSHKGLWARAPKPFDAREDNDEPERDGEPHDQIAAGDPPRP